MFVIVIMKLKRAYAKINTADNYHNNFQGKAAIVWNKLFKKDQQWPGDLVDHQSYLGIN